MKRREKHTFEPERRIPRTLVLGSLSLLILATAVLLPFALIFKPFLDKLSVQAQAISFTFGATGDHGMTSNGAAVLQQVAPNNLNFFLSLGDLRYDSSDPTPEPEWCQWVKDNINIGGSKPSGDTYGQDFPFAIVGGNHESGVTNPAGGILDNYVAGDCLPDRFQSTQSPI